MFVSFEDDFERSKVVSGNNMMTFDLVINVLTKLRSDGEASLASLHLQ
jgi:hypothetical protein